MASMVHEPITGIWTEPPVGSKPGQIPDRATKPLKLKGILPLNVKKVHIICPFCVFSKLLRNPKIRMPFPPTEDARTQFGFSLIGL